MLVAAQEVNSILIDDEGRVISEGGGGGAIMISGSSSGGTTRRSGTTTNTNSRNTTGTSTGRAVRNDLNTSSVTTITVEPETMDKDTGIIIPDTTFNHNIDRTNISTDEYINYANTPISSKYDMFGCYLASNIHFYSDDENVNINALMKWFIIDSIQAKKIIDSYSQEESSIISVPVFINNLKVDSDIFTSDKLVKDLSTNENAHNIFKLSTPEFECYVYFRREYSFNGNNADINKQINLSNTDNIVKFVLSNYDKNSNVSIKYADIYRTVWVNVESYFEISDITLFFETKDINHSKSVSIFNNDKYSIKTYNSVAGDNIHERFSLKNNYDNLYIDYNDYDAINSDYFYNHKSIGYNKESSTFKFYLSDSFLNDILQFEDYDEVENKYTSASLTYDDIEAITVFISLDTKKIIETGEAISTSNVFKVFTNTHADIDFIKTQTLYTSWNPQSNDDALVAVYKLYDGENDFNGNISIFYGNQIVYRGNEKQSGDTSNTVISIKKPNNENYKLNVLYYDILRKDKYLYVYIKTTKNEPFTFKKFVNIELSDMNTLSQAPSNFNNVNGVISQDNITVHNIDVSIPQVSKGDSLVLIDDSLNNKTKHYSYYSLINNTYYGVKAIGYIYGNNVEYHTSYYDNEIYKIGIPYLSYNVPAKIVKLYPEIEHKSIYSFKNGEQLIYLNKSNVTIPIKQKNDGTQTIAEGAKELLPHFRMSYDYIVNKTIPAGVSESTNDKYNIEFYPVKAIKDWVPASFLDIENPSKYQKHIPYELSYKISNSTEYVQISNSSPNYPIYQNFDDDANNNLYEYKYVKIYNNDYSEDNVYERIEEFVKIPAGSISLDTFKKIVYKSQNSEHDNAKYYKYLSLSKTYVPYIYDEVKDLDYVPLNIYTKYNYYLKRAKESLNNNSEIYKLDRSLAYVKNFNYNEAFLSGDTYFMYKAGLTYTSYLNGIAESSAYVPWKGFVRDGSGNYYGYLLTRLDAAYSNNRDYIINLNEYQCLIKQQYTPVTNKAGDSWFLSEEDINEYKINRVDLYVQQDKYALGFNPIENDYTIFNIDVSGNTIYASGKSPKDIIDIETIREKYYSDIHNLSNSEYNRENILREDRNSQYLLSNYDIDDKGTTIKYIVTFDGNYRKIDYINDFKNGYGLLSQYKYIFIKKEGYVPLEKFTSNETYKEFIDKLRKYNTDDKLYMPILTKLGADDLLDENVNKLYRYPYDPRRQGSRIFFKFDGNNNFRMVNEDTGLIDGLSVYKYSQLYEESYDLHTCIHKRYFEKIDVISYTGIYVTDSNDVLSIPGENGEEWTINKDYGWKNALNINNNIIWKDDENAVPSIENTVLTIKDSNVRFYEKGTYEYKYDTSYTNINTTDNSLRKFYDANVAYVDYNSIPDDCWTLDIFYKSRFLYEDFSFCDEIKVDTDGSYYTNVQVFDSKSGKISKKLTLNHHIYDIVKFTYALEEEYFAPIDSDYDISNINYAEYGKYFILQNDKYVSLLETGNTIAYYRSHNIGLYTKQINVSYNYYNNDFGTNQLGNPFTYEPSYIQKNDEFFGLIFNDSPEKEIQSSTILFEAAYNGTPDNPDDDNTTLNKYEIHDGIFDIFKVKDRIRIKEFDQYDNTSENSSEFSTDEAEIKNALIAANNELYYNNYTDYIDGEPIDLYVDTVTFKPNYFIYDIVPLSHFTFRNYDSDNSIIQAKKILDNSIVVNKPFSIANEEKVEFTGTYQWVPPKYKNIINSDGVSTYVIEREGYFEKTYNISKIPFNVTAYNYYPKDEISAINISYSFIPNSYIVSSVIEHPKISYDYMVNDTIEEDKYSYILNGFEYDYINIDKISYENGTYYGVIQLIDVEGEGVDTKISLYKRRAISTKTSVKTVTHQEPFVSYEYFSYIQATPLTNEKIPVLYNTELIPATSKRVEFWNENKNSYQVKTVIDSYAYYSYKYKYETVPFAVASYIFTEDLAISNFPVLGAYIDHISYSIGEKIGIQSNSIYTLTHDLSYIFNNILVQNKNIAYVHDNTFSSYSHSINKSLANIDNNLNESINGFRNDVSEKITKFTESEEKVISSLETNVVKEIIEHKNVLSTSFTKETNIIDKNLTELNSTMHADLIGDGASKEITTTYEKTTYIPVINRLSGKVSSYTSKTESGSNTIEVGGKSIGEILTNTLGTVSKYTTTDLNQDGSYTVTTYDGFIGIGEILAHLSINKKLPDYKEFMVDLVPKMFAAVDFEGNYEVEYDIFGNIKSKKKRNPTDIAKKCVMRGDILWKELKKKGIVS